MQWIYWRATHPVGESSKVTMHMTVAMHEDSLFEQLVNDMISDAEYFFQNGETAETSNAFRIFVAEPTNWVQKGNGGAAKLQECVERALEWYNTRDSTHFPNNAEGSVTRVGLDLVPLPSGVEIVDE